MFPRGNERERVRNMATPRKVAQPAIIPNLPSAWDAEGVEQLDGYDLIDKNELIGKPFLVTNIRFTTNERGVEYVYVDALDAAGDPFQFNDSSSTGVREQLVRHLTDRDKAGAVETGEDVPVRLAFFNGLRKSEYYVKDERGRDKLTRTYYLTLSGKRPSV
jgi:hypothetical protein